MTPQGLAPTHCSLPSWRLALVLWLGWLAMGQLGSVMAWSWFSGLGGVVAWWAWMQWAPSAWHPRSRASRWGWLLLALAGLAMAMLAGRHQPLGWLGWAMAIAGWAQTVLGLRHTLPAAGPTSALPLWQPVLLGAGLAWLVAAVAANPVLWIHTWPLAGALLLLASWPGRHASPSLACASPSSGAQPSPAVAQLATLLMMGSLPLMGNWCRANGQSVLLGTALHLWVMACAAGITHHLLAHSPRMPLRTQYGLGHALLLNAALLAWLGTDLWHMVLVMALLAAAATVWQHTRPTTHAIPEPRAVAWASHAMVPVVLLWLGHVTPTQGPQALAWALAALAGMALLQRPHRPWTGHRARPASVTPSLQPQPKVTP